MIFSLFLDGFVTVERPHGEPKKRVSEEKAMKIRELCKLLFEEKDLKLEEMSAAVRRLKKVGRSHSKGASRKRISFPENLSDEEDSAQSPFDYDRHSMPSLDRSSLETSFRTHKYAEERKDKFFSELLVELSSKAHPHEITSIRGYNTHQKEKTDIYSLVGCFKVTAEPQIANTSNSEFNELLKKSREEKQQELQKLITEKKEAEEKARREREAKEEERKRAEEAKRKQEEEARKRMEEEAKKRAMEAAKRQEEERKQAQQQEEQARVAGANAAPGGAAQGVPDDAARAATQANSQTSQENRQMTEFMLNHEITPQEIQELQQMRNLILPIREAITANGLTASQTVVIVTLRNVPLSWNTETAKQKLTQLQRKFVNARAEVKNGANVVVVKVIGFDDAIKYLLLKNLEGNPIQVELKLSENQNAQPQASPQPQGQPPRTQGQGSINQPTAQRSVAQTPGPSIQQQQARPSFGQPIYAQSSTYGQASQVGKPPSSFGQTNFLSQAGQQGGNTTAIGGKAAFGQTASFGQPASFGQTGGTTSFGKPSFGQPSMGGQAGQSQATKPSGFGSFGTGGQQQQQNNFIGFQGTLIYDRIIIYYIGAVQQNRTSGPSFGAAGGGSRPSMGGAGGSSNMFAARK